MRTGLPRRHHIRDKNRSKKQTEGMTDRTTSSKSTVKSKFHRQPATNGSRVRSLLHHVVSPVLAIKT